MTDAPWTIHLRRAFFIALGVVALLACAGGSVRAADEDDENASAGVEERLFKGILSAVGIKPKEDIDYRERSPLVVPPGRDLPPPESSAAGKNLAWPAELEAKPRGQPAARQADVRKPVERSSLKSEVAEPSDLGKIFGSGGVFKSLGASTDANEIGTFTTEPPRTRLTEPPPGYKTPSAAAPYGITMGGAAVFKPAPVVDAEKPVTHGGSE